MAQLQNVTCHMGSHSVTCYPTQVNTPRLNPSRTGRYSIYLPQRDGRLSWPSWLDSAPAGSRTSDLSITSPTLNQCNHQDNLNMKSSVCVACARMRVVRLVDMIIACQSQSGWHGCVYALQAATPTIVLVVTLLGTLYRNEKTAKRQPAATSTDPDQVTLNPHILHTVWIEKRG